MLTISSSDNSEIFVAVPRNRSDPDLVEWVLPASNPLLRTAARDPTELFASGNGRDLLLGTGTQSGTALWRCANCSSLEDVVDPARWAEDGLFHSNLDVDGGHYWECPDAYAVAGDTWVSKCLFPRLLVVT